MNWLEEWGEVWHIWGDVGRVGLDESRVGCQLGSIGGEVRRHLGLIFCLTGEGEVQSIETCIEVLCGLTIDRESAESVTVT